MGVKRWSLDKHIGRLFEAHHGKFVRFTDHAAEAVRLELRIAELTREVADLTAQLARTNNPLHDESKR